MSILESATSIAPTARCSGDVEHPVRIQDRAELQPGASLGAFGFLNIGAIVYSGVSVGKYLSCARGVEIGAIAHPMHYLSTHDFTVHPRQFSSIPGYGYLRGELPQHPKQKTTIGHDVWIGSQAVILAGLTVGTGAVIGANAVVTRDVKPYEVVAGVPARHMRFRFRPEIIDGLLQSEWWTLPHDRIQAFDFDNVEACLAKMGIEVRPLAKLSRIARLLFHIRIMRTRR